MPNPMTLPEVELEIRLVESSPDPNTSTEVALSYLRALRDALRELDALGPVEWQGKGQLGLWVKVAQPDLRDLTPEMRSEYRAIRVVKGGA